MRYTGRINTPFHSKLPVAYKYEVYVNNKLVLTTFDKFTAEVERKMAAGDCKVLYCPVYKS